MTFSVTAGWVSNTRSSDAPFSGVRFPASTAARRRPSLSAVSIATLTRSPEPLRETHIQVHVHKRRDMENFLTMLIDRRAVGIDRDQISMALSECIVDFVENSREQAVKPVTEIDAQRIEAVAENTRHAEQANRAAAGIDPCGSKLMIDLTTQRCGTAVAVIGVVETERIEAIAGEQSKRSGRRSISSRSSSIQNTRYRRRCARGRRRRCMTEPT